LLSAQQVAQMGNFDRKRQRYLASMQYKIRARHNTFFHNNHNTK